MAKQTISIGTVANDHTGDPLRTAFNKVNANFTELYTTVSNIPTDINELTDTDSLLGQGSSFNIGSVDLHNGGVQTGQILQFTDNTHQSIITGPAPSGVDVSAQRVIIQGQRATGQGEGGDVYLWGGDSDVNGGDIKIYAGDADSNSAGQGGYIHLTSGTGYVQGGNLTLQGGSSTTTGGDLYLSSGYGGVNHGQVFLNSGGSQWTFGKTGDLSLPANGGIVFDRNNTSIRVGMGFHISSGEGVSIEAIDQTDPDNLVYKGWYFSPEGSLTLPGTILHNTNSVGIGGTSRIEAVTLDVTKSVHKLTSGWYYLPDGVEGQLTYLTLATGSTPLDIKVDFQHARINQDVNTPYDNGPIFSNVFGVTIGNRPPSLVTAIFIDGAWVCSPDGVWD